MRKQADPSLTVLLGHACAYVQHGMDKVIEWGFAKIKEAGEMEPQRAAADGDSNPYLRNAAKAARKALGFLGTAGSAYYEKYEQLKNHTTHKTSAKTR